MQKTIPASFKVRLKQFKLVWFSLLTPGAGFILKPGYPHSFIKGKICMKQEIAEWSPTGDIDKDFSLKPKLIAWILVFLFECGNQFFCSSAR